MPTEAIYTIVLRISSGLFEAEYRRLDAVISSLNQRNKRLYDAKVDGFLYAGQFYLPRDATLRTVGAVAKTPLHGSVENEMIAFLADREIVTTDQGFIRQTLHALLRLCRTDQQARDALPECLVSCYPSFARLPRYDEVAHSIRDNPRALRQFEKFLPKMELYSALKLLY